MKFFYKTTKLFLIVLVVVLLLDIGFVLAMGKWQPAIEESDAVIVLGAAINTPSIKNRTLEGLQLYEEGKADKMILSGGKIANADISEAEYMAKVISKNASGPVDFELEDQSRNTYDNINNSKAMLGDADSIIIVSDEYHLARAFLLAKRAGFETVYWSAPDSSYYSEKDLRFYYFREFIAMLDYLPKFIFG